MNISRAQADKLVVGTTDVGYLPTDRNPVGTTVLNGPVFVGLPVAAPIYKAVLNVGPPAPPSLPGLNPPLVTPFSMWVDGLSNQVGVHLHQGTRIQKGMNFVTGRRVTNGSNFTSVLTSQLVWFGVVQLCKVAMFWQPKRTLIFPIHQSLDID